MFPVKAPITIETRRKKNRRKKRTIKTNIVRNKQEPVPSYITKG